MRLGSYSVPFQPLLFAESTADVRRRRRRKRFMRFVVLEVMAIALAIGSVIAGVSERFAAEWLTPAFRFLPIAAAATATILPIVFFGSPSHRRRRKRLVASGSPMHSAPLAWR